MAEAFLLQHQKSLEEKNETVKSNAKKITVKKNLFLTVRFPTENHPEAVIEITANRSSKRSKAKKKNYSEEAVNIIGGDNNSEKDDGPIVLKSKWNFSKKKAREWIYASSSWTSISGKKITVPIWVSSTEDKRRKVVAPTFPCTHSGCGKSFADQRKLNRHLKTHMKKKAENAGADESASSDAFDE